MDKSFEVLRVGGVGMILVNDKISGSDIETDAHMLPTSHVSYIDGLSIAQYLKSTK